MLQLLQPALNPKAWARFVQVGMPKKNQEGFRYLRLSELYQTPFQSPLVSSERTPLPSSTQATFVFVNGSYCEALSHFPPPLIALPLTKAQKIYSGFLKQRLHKLLEEEKDPFALLNQAYCSEGLFLYLPPETGPKDSLHIVHLIDPELPPTLLSPRIHLFAAKGSAVKLSLHQTLASASLWVNGFIDCALEEEAQVDLTLSCHQQLPAHECLAVRATLKRGSLFKSCAVNHGGITSKHDYQIQLLEEGAAAYLYGIWKLEAQNQHHVRVLMEHLAPSCRSLQQFKSLVADRSLSSFEGKIYVARRAQKTDAYQRNHNLLLSPHASANSQPNLQIFADDVKASHGATIGTLDEQQLFYLISRGVPRARAIQLLVKGFSQEIVDQISGQEQKARAWQILA